MHINSSPYGSLAMMLPKYLPYSKEDGINLFTSCIMLLTGGKAVGTNVLNANDTMSGFKGHLRPFSAVRSHRSNVFSKRKIL